MRPNTYSESSQPLKAIHQCQEEGTYQFFANNMHERLSRLKNIGDCNDQGYIKQLAKDLATRNWDGALSELIVYDYFYLLGVPFQTEYTISSEKTYAKILKNSDESSIDGKVGTRVNFEIKSFRSKSIELINSIKEDRSVEEAMEQSGASWITEDHRLDVDYKKIQENRESIVKGLSKAIQNNESIFQPPNLNFLSFTIHFERKPIYMKEQAYNPYKHAKELKYFSLLHPDQLLLHEPNLIVYVVHPWFNFVSVDNLGDKKRKFFRSFCRRTFCGLIKEKVRLLDIMPNRWPNGHMFISEIIRRISGIMFLIDKSVADKDNFDSNNPLSLFESYIYTNPNVNTENFAATKLQEIARRGSGRILKYDYDNLIHDNY